MMFKVDNSKQESGKILKLEMF